MKHKARVADPVTEAQFDKIIYMIEEEDVTLLDIMDKLLCDYVRANYLVDRLRKKGFIQRRKKKLGNNFLFGVPIETPEQKEITFVEVKRDYLVEALFGPYKPA